jgi:hypothetical protein
MSLPPPASNRHWHQCSASLPQARPSALGKTSPHKSVPHRLARTASAGAPAHTGDAGTLGVCWDPGRAPQHWELCWSLPSAHGRTLAPQHCELCWSLPTAEGRAKYGGGVLGRYPDHIPRPPPRTHACGAGTPGGPSRHRSMHHQEPRLLLMRRCATTMLNASSALTCAQQNDVVS